MNQRDNKACQCPTSTVVPCLPKLCHEAPDLLESPRFMLPPL